MEYYTDYYEVRGGATDTCFFDIAINQERKIMHILDIGRFANSVTNAIDHDMQRDLVGLYSENFDGSDKMLNEWTFVLYGTDCRISEFKDGKFIPLSIRPDEDMQDRMIRIWHNV